jgi:hypothetical protein
MADMASSRAGNGVAFLVSAGIMAEIIAKACSSPQTVEINAFSRAGTLMKWVNIGLVEGTLFVIAAAVIDPKHRKAILAGGLLEAAITLGEYLHGKQSGLKSAAPGTEDAGVGPGRGGPWNQATAPPWPKMPGRASGAFGM